MRNQSGVHFKQAPVIDQYEFIGSDSGGVVAAGTDLESECDMAGIAPFDPKPGGQATMGCTRQVGEEDDNVGSSIVFYLQTWLMPKDPPGLFVSQIPDDS